MQTYNRRPFINTAPTIILRVLQLTATTYHVASITNQGFILIVRVITPSLCHVDYGIFVSRCQRNTSIL